MDLNNFLLIAMGIMILITLIHFTWVASAIYHQKRVSPSTIKYCHLIFYLNCQIKETQQFIDGLEFMLKQVHYPVNEQEYNDDKKMGVLELKLYEDLRNRIINNVEITPRKLGKYLDEYIQQTIDYLTMIGVISKEDEKVVNRIASDLVLGYHCNNYSNFELKKYINILRKLNEKVNL